MDAVSYEGGVFIVKWGGALHNAPEQEAMPSIDHRCWLCETARQKPRCCFRPTMGA